MWRCLNIGDSQRLIEISWNLSIFSRISLEFSARHVVWTCLDTLPFVWIVFFGCCQTRNGYYLIALVSSFCTPCLSKCSEAKTMTP